MIGLLEEKGKIKLLAIHGINLFLVLVRSGAPANIVSPSATTIKQVISPSAQSSASKSVAQESSHDNSSVAPSDAPMQEPLNEPELETSL
jgi:hypothetical protein